MIKRIKKWLNARQNNELILEYEAYIKNNKSIYSQLEVLTPDEIAQIYDTFKSLIRISDDYIVKLDSAKLLVEKLSSAMGDGSGLSKEEVDKAYNESWADITDKKEKYKSIIDKLAKFDGLTVHLDKSEDLFPNVNNNFNPL